MEPNIFTKLLTLGQGERITKRFAAMTLGCAGAYVGFTELGLSNTQVGLLVTPVIAYILGQSFSDAFQRFYVNEEIPEVDSVSKPTEKAA